MYVAAASHYLQFIKNDRCWDVVRQQFTTRNDLLLVKLPIMNIAEMMKN